jgi:hypothetical protein
MKGFLNEINAKNSKIALIKKMILYILAIVVIFIIALGAIKYLLDTDKKLETIRDVELAQKIQNDSIFNVLKTMKKDIFNNTNVINDLKDSYVKYIKNDKTLTRDDFINYMEGVLFNSKKELINSVVPNIPQSKSDTFKTNITVKKIIK